MPEGNATESTHTRRVCMRCIMDESDPTITFDQNGICNHCLNYDRIVAQMRLISPEEKERKLQSTLSVIRNAGKKSEYDCIVGLSGGVDSSYLAYKAKELGLRPLAVHVDAGWNSELAVKNIEVLVKNIGIDLFTYVVDWEEMRDLQLSFLKASVANQDVPQDHVFMATLYRVARQHGVHHILGGSNVSTESILPAAWGYNARDLRHLKSIHSKFGNQKLKTFPTMNFFESYFYYPFVMKIETVHLLNYMDYVKQDAMTFLQEKLGWRYYGGKHYESVFTKFFQAYYLPQKFGYDKRKAHLSSLIVSGQMSREEALKEMEKPLYTPEQLREDKLYISKKVGVSVEEFDRLLSLPNKTFRDYPSNEWLFGLKNKVMKLLRRKA